MMRSVALLLLLLSSVASAQTVDWIEQFQNQGFSKFAISVQTEVLRNRFDASNYLVSKVVLQYQTGLWRAQATINNNYEQIFQIEPEPTAISLPQMPRWCVRPISRMMYIVPISHCRLHWG
jgi:hypothetical protein